MMRVNFSPPQPPPIPPAAPSLLLLPPSSCVFSCSPSVTPRPRELLKIQEEVPSLCHYRQHSGCEGENVRGGHISQGRMPH